MKPLLKTILWIAITLAGAGALAAIAFERREPLNAVWFVVASVCTYLVAYRFYSAFLAAKVFALDDSRATPAERLEDGRDFVPTNKWVLLGHHFAAIAGPGPLVGPTLAAQFGYLPGTLWLIIDAVLGGCVLESSAIGVSLVLLDVVAGQWVAGAPSWARIFSLSAPALAVGLIIYGFAASALP